MLAELRALGDARVPLDFVGGTSQGAFMGALIARAAGDAGQSARPERASSGPRASAAAATAAGLPSHPYLEQMDLDDAETFRACLEARSVCERAELLKAGVLREAERLGRRAALQRALDAS